jgi:type IX secretion system substrate protein
MKKFTILLFQVSPRIIITGSFLVFCLGLIAQTSNSLIESTTVDAGTLVGEQLSRYQKIQTSDTYSSSEFVEVFNLANNAQDGTVTLNITNNACGDITYKAEMVKYTSENEYYWYGEVASDDTTSCNDGYLMLLSKNSKKFGIATIDDEAYELIDLGNQLNMLAYIDSTSSNGLVCGNGGSQGSLGKIDPGNNLDNNTSGRSTGRNCRVDALALYTANADDKVTDIEQTIEIGMGKLEQALHNSDISASELTVNLVGTVEVDFVETNNSTNDVATLAGGIAISAILPDGRNVTTLRNDFAADIVLMFTDGNYTGVLGEANMVAVNAATAFAVIQAEQVSGTVVTQHEAMHLLACRHEDCDASETSPSCDTDGTFQHAHTFKTGVFPFKRKRRTLMFGSAEKPRRTILHFSNPGVEFKNKATGDSEADNARQIIAQACNVGDFRQPVEPVPLTVGIKGDIFTCPCKPVSLEAISGGGSNGAVQFVWQTSTNGIDWGSVQGTNSTFFPIVPCTEGDGIFIRVTATSSTNQTATNIHFVEAKDPPNPNGDCPIELIVVPGSDEDVYIWATPNPSSDELTVNYVLEKSGNASLTLFDLHGNKLRKLTDAWHKEGNHQMRLSGSTLQNGTYLLRLKTATGIHTEKIMILK